MLLYHILGEHDGEFGAWAFHKGATAASPRSSPGRPQSFGVEIRLESPVEQVITKNGRATGVALADGTEFHAPIVVSALDPRRTFLELVEPRELPTDLVDTIERFRFQGTSAKVNFALDGPPRYPALGDRTDQYRGFTNIGPSMEYLERAYDDAKYGWYSKRPYLDCAIQSTVDPDMAPPGKAVMSCFVQYAPYHLREQRLGHREGGPRATRSRRPSSRSSRASATWSSSARSGRRSTSSGRSGCRRATSSPASSSRRRCSSSGRRPAGASTGRRSTATTSAARGRIRAAA